MITTIIGIVESNLDPNNAGEFTAKFSISEKPLPVIYTSQMYKKGSGGHFAVPERGDEILAFYDDTTDLIYYQSTILHSELPTVRAIPNFTTLGDESKYNTFNQPVKVTYQNQVGAGLCITRNYEGPPSIVMANSVALVSEKGKRLSLDDSPETDGIYMKTHNKDGIIISGDDNAQFGPGTMQVKTRGPQYYTCMGGHIEMSIQEGRDITIENQSTGRMGQTPSEPWPNGNSEQPPKKFGGIYLRSVNGDVSLASQAEDGRIFIKTPKGEIQITEKGDIVISNTGNLNVYSEGSIDIEAKGDFRLAAANIDLGTGGNIKAVAGGTGAISSGGAMAIDGSTIDLKPTSPVGSAAAPQRIDPLLNDYRD